MYMCVYIYICRDTGADCRSLADLSVVCEDVPVHGHYSY